MSDHLIAEANRHAKALTDKRNNLVVELNMLREWQREVIQNEKAHHAEREDANARAELAEADLAAEREKLSTPREACGHISYIPRTQSALDKTAPAPDALT